MVHPVKSPFTAADYLESTVSRSMVNEWVSMGVPLWATLIDEFLFVVASVIFIFASFDFYPSASYAQYVEGCQLFIIGSMMYLALALFDVFEIVAEARLSNKDPPASQLMEQGLYVVGSVFFAVGTVLFTPPIDVTTAPADPSSKEILSVPWFGRTVTLQTSALPEPPDASIVAGDILFIIGSVLFTVAAFSSALMAAGEVGGDTASMIRRRTAVATASLYQGGSIAYIVGTLGFIPSRPLGIDACPDGARIMSDAGATLFVIGSVLYALGAVITFLAVAYLTFDKGSNGYVSVRGSSTADAAPAPHTLLPTPEDYTYTRSTASGGESADAGTNSQNASDSTRDGIEQGGEAVGETPTDEEDGPRSTRLALGTLTSGDMTLPGSAPSTNGYTPSSQQTEGTELAAGAGTDAGTGAGTGAGTSAEVGTGAGAGAAAAEGVAASTNAASSAPDEHDIESDFELLCAQLKGAVAKLSAAAQKEQMLQQEAAAAVARASASKQELEGARERLNYQQARFDAVKAELAQARKEAAEALDFFS